MWDAGGSARGLAPGSGRGLLGAMEQRWGLPVIAWPSRLRRNYWDLVALPLVLGLVALVAWGGMAMSVRYQTGETAKQFRQSQRSLSSLHQKVHTVPGVGDKAYFASVGTAHGASNTLAALSGTVAVFVTAPRPLATERSLMKHLLNKI